MLSLNPPQYAEFSLGVGKEIFEVGENFFVLLLFRVEGAPHQGASKLEATVEYAAQIKGAAAAAPHGVLVAAELTHDLTLDAAEHAAVQVLEELVQVDAGLLILLGIWRLSGTVSKV